MRFRSMSLGLKLNLALLVFFLTLGAATSALVIYGFNRTQDNAHDRSEEALEELGMLALKAFAAGAAESGGLQFEAASEIGQRSAVAMEAFHRTGATISLDLSTLARTEGGLLYDPDPDRTSDLIMLPYASSDDPAVQDEIVYGAALDTIFEAVSDSFEEAVGGRNFDPNAIGFIGANGTGRYYPPRGIHELIPPDLDISGLLLRAGPSENPMRTTTWTRPYEDAIGQGLVVTAESPVYEGDTYRGVIQVDLLIEDLIIQIDSVHPTPGGFAFYVDTEGELLRTDAFDRLTLESAANADLAGVLNMMSVANVEPEPVVERATLGGDDYFIAFAPMPSLGGSFAVAAPVSEITAEAAAITASIEEQGTRTLWAMLTAMGALFLAGLAGAGYLNRRVLLRPIGELLRGTSAVGSGDLDTTIAVGSRDELGALAAGFNSMVDELRTRGEVLEQEVRERREAQTELSALFAAMDDLVIVIDSEGRCLRSAPTNHELLAPLATDVVGRRLHDFMPVEVADLILGQIQATIADASRKTAEYPLDAPGGERWFSAAITPLGEDRVLFVSRDVTERARAAQLLEDRVEERTRELRILLDVSRDVASTLDMQELATRILDQLAAAIPCDGAGLLLRDGDELVMLDARDAAGRRDQSIVGSRHQLPLVGPSGDALERRVPVVVEDARSDARLYALQRDVPGPAAAGRSWLAVPLIAKEQPVGVLTLWSLAPDTYGDQHADLALAVANQAAVAIDNARLFAQASSVAALEERQRLARELHDSVSQALYGIALGAQTARQLLDDGDASGAAGPVEYVLSLAEAGLAEMRALIFELQPDSLATEGLVSALQKQAAATKARYELEVETTLPSEPDASSAVKEALYRIAQEAMHNTVKHARATTITLGLTAQELGLQLEVSDDGVGFDADGDFPGHLGLQSMRERIQAVGGSIEIVSQPGAGTHITATVPR
jgi:PAS domain S-box-containing protein